MMTIKIIAMNDPAMIPMTRDMVPDIPRIFSRGASTGALVT